MVADTDESDEKPPERYRRLFVELELARRAAGGLLSPVEEARRADELDRTWWAMTNAEQDEYERAMGRTIAKIWRKGRAAPLPTSPPLPRMSRVYRRLGIEPLDLVELAVILAYGLTSFGLGYLCHSFAHP